MRSGTVLAIAAIALPALARAEDEVAACRDEVRYPTVAHREDCLARSGDARAIPELHEMARQSREHFRDARWPNAVDIASSAGQVAVKTDIAYLEKLAREGDPFDRWFAIRALNIGWSHLDPLRERPPRAEPVRRALEQACRENESSNDQVLRGEAERCLLRLAPPATERRVQRGSKGGLLSVLSQDEGKNVDLFAGDAPALTGTPSQRGVGSVRLACLQGAVRGTIELCYPDMPPLGRDDHLAVTVKRHPSPFPRGKPAWKVERPDEASEQSHTTTVPLRAGETVAPKGVRVLGRDGDRFLVLVSIVRGKAEPHATARAVLLVLDAAAGWVGTPWTSAACDGGCRTPEAAARSAPGAKEVSITLRSVAGSSVQRVMWKNESLEPVSN